MPQDAGGSAAGERTHERSLDALALVPPLSRCEVARAVSGLGLRLDFVARVDLLAARLESACPGLILVDTDMLDCPDTLCMMARSLRADVRLAGLVNYWSESEVRLAGCMDAVLHKPPRPEEWDAVLRPLLTPEPPRP
ncbi:MAG: hypothetical protein WEC75_09255 [Dehalococcoidia bacterium]